MHVLGQHGIIMITCICRENTELEKKAVEDMNPEVPDIKVEVDIAEDAPSVIKMEPVSDEEEESVDKQHYLVSGTCLLQLLYNLHPNCHICQNTTHVKLKKTGTGVYCEWVGGRSSAIYTPSRLLHCESIITWSLVSINRNPLYIESCYSVL